MLKSWFHCKKQQHYIYRLWNNQSGFRQTSTPQALTPPKKSLDRFAWISWAPTPGYATAATSTLLQADTHSSTLLRFRCPNYLNLPCLTTSATFDLYTQKTVQIHTAFPILQRHPAHPSPFRPLQRLCRSRIIFQNNVNFNKILYIFNRQFCG